MTSWIEKEINGVLRQQAENEKYGEREEKKFKKMIYDINIKIRKANLKSTRENLLKKKKEIKADYDESNHIGYRCQQSCILHLSYLYDLLNNN